VQYNFDFGAKTRVQSPPPQNQPTGIIQTFTYDDAQRVKRSTVVNTGAYSHYEYGPNYTQAFASVNTVSADPHLSDSFSNQVFDGLGRVIGVSANHPNSTGGYKAQVMQYDIMGRMIKQSNPTEITSNWVPSGDDAAGWVYTQQTYDWKGHPLETRHLTDGSIKYASYGGCGCAGGEVVTLTDEVGRQQVLYHDVLGRLVKTEILQTVNNNTSVYGTTANTYNARDQLKLVRQFQGDDQSSVFQNTTMDYDGYGRLKTKHLPEQGIDPTNSSSTDHTTWEYNADDTILKLTDARGASATYVYNNNRGLVNGINYYSPSGVVTTPNVTFGYDAAGNRTSMTDATGNTNYHYDSLSRMDWEDRTFTGLATYRVSYGYNLAGELTNVTDPFGQAVSYNYDSTGRLNGMNGTGFPNVSQLASSIQYRAWGGIKNMTYGNGKTLSVGYNARLAPASYQIPAVLNKTYQYFDDGAMKYAGDLLDNRYDRAMQYDQVGRLAAAQTGTEARGGATSDGPFRQTYQYDAFGNTTARFSRQWNTNFTDSGTYQDERHNGWRYDADGKVLANDDVQFTYDAAGEATQTVNVLGGSINGNGFDGDGRRIKSAFQLNSSSAATAKYYLRATALGGKVIADILSSGEKAQGYVYAGNELMAVQKLPVVGDVSDYVVWRHQEPSGSVRGTDVSGGQNWAAELNSAELDATGVDMKREDPGPGPLNTLEDENNPDFHAMGNPSRLSGGCTFNGMPITDCGFLLGESSFDQFNLVSVAAKASTRVVSYRNKGVSWGTPFEATYDENGQTTLSMGEFDPNLQDVNYGNISPIYASSLNISFLLRSVPQNPAPGQKLDVDKLYGWWGPCNRSANDLMRTVRRDFSKFGNFAEPVAGGTALAGIHFDSGPITQGRVIGITVGAVSTVDPLLSYSQHVSVTVNPASTMGFTFITNPGHFFYPGTISFSARDVTSNGASAVEFQITAKGQLNGATATLGFYGGGGDFEDDAWKSFLAKVRESCGNK
jgi:YD repeat-containing protein